MYYLSMAYDDFDRLSDDLGSIICPTPELPTWEVLDLFKGSDIQYLAGFFVFLIEHPKKSMVPDEKARLKYINRMIQENIAFCECAVRTSEDLCIHEKDYRRICKALEAYASAQEAPSPPMECFQACLDPWAGYCFALGLWLLVANKDQRKSTAYQDIRDLLAGKYRLKADKGAVRLSEKEYGKLREEMWNFRYPHIQWWPTREEVEEVIAPNIGICYDFVLWLLAGYKSSGTEPEDVARMLERLLAENIHMKGMEDLVWS